MNDESDISLEDALGIGVDIVEIRRFRDLTEDSPFFHRVFTEQELDYCLRYSDASPHLAAIFAGKEAVVKALRGKTAISMKSIEICHEPNGMPRVKLCQLPEIKILLSLAHSKEYAVAIALLIPPSDITSEPALQNLLNERISELLQGCG